jgi:hypothetical protein
MGYEALPEDEKTVIFADEMAPESSQSECPKSLALAALAAARSTRAPDQAWHGASIPSSTLRLKVSGRAFGPP